ncbi:MAG: hypothetical protein ETSY1_24670, partial [Candidatus Entotheonella factor]
MQDFVWGSKRLRTIALVLWAAVLVMGLAAEIASAVEVPLPTKETLRYGDFPVVGRRVAVWVIAQLHLMFGAFVVGVPLFILIIEILGAATKNKQFDDLAHEFTRLLSVAFSTTATFGGILVFFLIGLYPTLTDFLARIFFPSMVVYVFLFFGESFSMYLYYYGWDALKGSSKSFGSILGTALLSTLVFYPGVLLISSILRGIFGADPSLTFPLSYVLTGLLMIGLFVHALLPGRSNFLHSQKWMHICFGILLNYFGLILMMISNSWATFMTSPVGIDMDAGVFRGTTWEAMNNFTWMPVNLHRFIANIAFGGSVVAAYAGFRFLAAPKNSADRAHYDWMAYIGNFVAIIGLIPLPFAGYWLGREIYGYDQQLGITMMGGIFSWLFIIQAVLIGVLFLAANYYLWLGMERIPGAERYRKYIPWLLGILTVCVIIWMTPHSLVASLEEARKMGGAHHPLLGVFGVMSAKNTVANIMILATLYSFLLYRRGNKSTPLPYGSQPASATVWLIVGMVASFGLIYYLGVPEPWWVIPVEVACIVAAVALTFGNRAVWGENLLFAMSTIIVVGYGIYGYYVEAIVRIGFSIHMVGSVFLVLIMATTIDIVAYRGAPEVGA